MLVTSLGSSIEPEDAVMPLLTDIQTVATWVPSWGAALHRAAAASAATSKLTLGVYTAESEACGAYNLAVPRAQFATPIGWVNAVSAMGGVPVRWPWRKDCLPRSSTSYSSGLLFRRTPGQAAWGGILNSSAVLACS